MENRFVPGKTVEVPEIPFKDEIELAPDNTTLLVIDMQSDFVKRDGALVVSDANDTVPRIQELLASAREQEMPIAYTQDTQVEGDPEFDIWPEHCVKGTWG
jgi:nicotinamidase-related amidase